MMTFTPAALGLIAVLIIGYLAAISIGTWAYFSNEKDY
ncbi:MAG: endonuclease [Cyanobacteria bacterium P01_G01_bin.39]